METHFVKLSMNSACANVASRGSLELGIEFFNQRHDFSMLRASALSGSVLSCVDETNSVHGRLQYLAPFQHHRQGARAKSKVVTQMDPN